MPGLTVSEKNHWKDRLAKRIDKKLEAVAAEDPHLLDRVKREARERALQSLGLADFQQELDQIERDEKQLDQQKARLERQMLAHLRGVPADSVDIIHTSYMDREVDQAVERRRSVHEEELMADSEIGRRILNLCREKDSLLDSVWLASSPRQIKALWSKVAELLGDEQTQLQRDALAIDPVEE
ncbi:MAG: hypothetical protein HZA46_06270 [Planctomycetales bacterium]|nr:hypothetical protein [Planctomycetales bacterium]